MDLAFTKDDLAFRDEVRDFVAKNLPRDIADKVAGGKHLERDDYMRWQQALGRKGWLVYTWPKKHGGPGWTVTQRYIFENTCAEMNAPGIIPFGSKMVGPVIYTFGSEEQKRRFLPRFASGELRGGIALTEPDCGTDLQAIRTQARRQGDHYVVNGAKTWITNSAEGQILAVLVKSDPRALPAHRGMSLLLIEKGPGFKVVRRLDKLGYRGIDTAELLFEDCRVPAANLIGAQEGRGLQQVLNGLELGRINVAARGAGLARACLEESLRYAQQRRTFGKPIAEHQAIQIKLADMATRVEAARLLVEHAARAYDGGGRCDLEAGMAKLYATEAALENSLEAMRIHGAYGYSKEFNIERYYRDAPLLAIGEGTNELQRIVIARELVKRHPA
jgi:alkylation response protein AidB-like acyl-CoA dehydrogenase